MIEELEKICKTIKNADLTIHNTYRLHSECYALVFPNDVKELITVLDKLSEYKTKYLILGNGSNVILPEYYDGVVIKLKGLNKCIVSDNEVYVEAGCMINKVANNLAKEGYKGLDFACGIPGTIGGSIYGNAGCYGSSISDTLISAIILDGRNTIELSNEELKFGYRTSILKEKKDWIVLSAKFKIEKTDKEELKKLIAERMQKRASSQPLEFPSCGSVFRNPEGLIAGKLIDDLGLKGTRVNGAVVSQKHANFIINDGDATGEDIISLIKKNKKEVKKEYVVDLDLEQEIIK